MESHSFTLIIVLCILILFSAFFSATETAFSSLNRIRIKNLAQSGNKRAKQTLKLADNFDNLLSTILVGNNIVNIASTSIATLIFVTSLGNIGTTVSTIVMTVVVLIFGEVTPKSLAKEVPEKYAMFATPLMRFFVVLFKPVNFLFSKLKAGLNKLFKLDDNRVMTDSELLTIVEEAEQDGGIDSDESELIRNVIEFDDIEAIDIMTPRVDVRAVSINTDNETVAAIFTDTGYSRLPVYDETIDTILGVINEKNFYSTVWGTDKTISDILRPAEFIPPSMKISSLMKLLQTNKNHMAIIVDEFGGTEGVITLEDIIEELVGEIWDEHDQIALESFRKVGINSYCVYTTTDLDDFFDFFNIRVDTDASTINGWITEKLDKIPQVGDSFDFMSLVIKVVQAENNRVIELEVIGSPIPDDAYEPDEN